jgi:hypothetical protein
MACVSSAGSSGKVILTSAMAHHNEITDTKELGSPALFFPLISNLFQKLKTSKVKIPIPAGINAIVRRDYLRLQAMGYSGHYSRVQTIILKGRNKSWRR